MTTTVSSGSAAARRARAASRSSRPGQVEPGSRLVEEQQARLRDESPGDQRPLALSLGAVAEAALCEAAEPEHAEQRVGPVDVEHREPLLEVPDRAGRARPDHLADREERSEPVAVTRVDEPDPLAQAGDVSVRPIVSPRSSTVPRLGNPTAPVSVSSVVLPAPFGPSSGPALAGPAPSTRSRSSERLAGAGRVVPAPDLHVSEPDRGRGLTRLRICPYTY